MYPFKKEELELLAEIAVQDATGETPSRGEVTDAVERFLADTKTAEFFAGTDEERGVGAGGLTQGEQIVGTDFNPAGSPKVKALKRLFAAAYDIAVWGTPTHGLTLATQIANGAASAILWAQMACVKLVTWRQ